MKLAAVCRSAIAALVVGLTVPQAVHAHDQDDEAVLAETTNGPVIGSRQGGVERFRGLRYAAAPIGDLRFQPPASPAAWHEPRSAREFGPRCIQAVLALGSGFDDGSRQSEDCLFLNVWTPGGDGSRRPVMVWLHGGGFAWGSGGEKVYDGTNLARQGDVVVVTLNHRLNLFGFSNLSQMGPEFSNSVNLGMHDVVKALEWVRDNIAAFGGDPANVTIFGESGGAAKVSHLLGMPAAKGLFGKAIIQSGADARGLDPASIADDTWRIFQAAGMQEYDPAFIRTVPAELLVERAINLFKQGDEIEVRFRRTGDMEAVDMAARLRTVMDGESLQHHPFDPVASALADDVHLLLGWTKDEWTRMLVAEDPTFVDITEQDLQRGAATMYSGYGSAILAELRKGFPDYSPGHLAAALTSAETSYETVLAASRKAEQRAPVFVYSLRWETPVRGGIYRSPHALDLPLVFNNVELSRDFLGPGPQPQQMADTMMQAWVAFARHGTPQTEALPHWPAYEPQTRSVMFFDLESRVVSDPLARVHQLIACARDREGLPADAEPRVCNTIN